LAIDIEVQVPSDRRFEGRSLSVLEGGYNLEALPELVNAYLDGLTGARAN